ncbi:MAG: sulfatase-like hydrolase/transferase [Rhodoferax sp.]|nr:sulfatase-like hydrolase/transferase [Rhodoferax sp.]
MNKFFTNKFAYIRDYFISILKQENGKYSVEILISALLFTFSVLYLRSIYSFPRGQLGISIIIAAIGFFWKNGCSRLFLIAAIPLLASDNAIEDTSLIISIYILLRALKLLRISNIVALTFIALIYLSWIKVLNTQIGITGFDLRAFAFSILMDMIYAYQAEVIIMMIILVTLYFGLSRKIYDYKSANKTYILYNKNTRILISSIGLTITLLFGLNHDAHEVMTGKTIIASLKGIRPEVFSLNADQKILFQNMTQITTSCPNTRKNLFLVLEESTFFDGSDHSFFFGNSHGRLNVNTFGGQTWLAEFSLMNGLPHTIFNAGEYATFTSINKLFIGLPSRLSKCGYRSIAFIPTSMDFVNSGNWYKSLGFDEVVSIRDHGLKAFNTSDSEIFDFALAKVNRESEPLFIYLLTINQHGPHDRFKPMDDYKTRLGNSADAFHALKQKLDTKEWILGWFGDHRPAFTKDMPDQFKTWFSIFDDSRASSNQEIDISFLNDLILKKMNFDDSISKERSIMIKDCELSSFSTCSKESLDRFISFLVASKLLILENHH